MSDGTNRRRNRRYRRRLPVRFWNDEVDGTGFTADVSNGGMLIETQKLPEIETRLHFELTIEETSYLGECTVARKRPRPRYAHTVTKPAMGVRFIGLIEAIRTASPEASQEERIAERQATPCDEPASAEPPASVTERPTLDLSEPAVLKAAFERDLQFGGVFLDTTEEPEVDSEIAIAVVLPPPNGTIPVRGVVVKLSDAPPGVALRLLEFDRVKARIEEILELFAD